MQSIKNSFETLLPPKMVALKIADTSVTIWPQKNRGHLHHWVMISLVFGPCRAAAL